MSLHMNARQGGFALALTIIVIAGLAVLASGAMMVGMNSRLIRHYNVHQDELATVADAGLELARARLNANPSLYPDSGYTVLELDSVVTGAGGQVLTGVTRSLYVGPIGITSGQYGVHGAVVAVVRSGPNTLIRRANVVQESFSKFAYFTHIEGAIVFGGSDQILGPAHSNDDIEIHATGATFHSDLTVSGRIVNRNNGTYLSGYSEYAPQIPLPQVADLDNLETQAIAGGTAFTAPSGSNAVGRARMRIEFIARDLNGDGDTTDENEGFIRVYRGSGSSAADWVVGANSVTNLRTSRNCGHVAPSTASRRHTGESAGNFYAAGSNPPHTNNTRRDEALSWQERVCYLGGAPEITNGWVSSNSDGSWDSWGGTVSSLLSSGAHPDRNHLFPITRALNPSFKGVVFVDGDVAVSGVVRGRVTVAATGDIVIADDITYATPPSVGNCEDILGLFAGGDVVISRTPINSPWRINNSGSWRTYDDSADEHIDAFILTLNSFFVEGFDQPPTDAEECRPGDTFGRGCIFLNGGIIQRVRGAVGQSTGTGYVKRYDYDPCGATAPPPYFPTTGRFSRNAYYEVDPTGFDVDAYFAMLAAGS